VLRHDTYTITINAEPLEGAIVVAWSMMGSQAAVPHHTVGSRTACDVPRFLPSLNSFGVELS